jgi:hypothetical protein
LEPAGFNADFLEREMENRRSMKCCSLTQLLAENVRLKPNNEISAVTHAVQTAKHQNVAAKYSIHRHETWFNFGGISDVFST